MLISLFLQGYDGGFGQGPNQESHGGSTYCACASLQLLGRLPTALTTKQIRRYKMGQGWATFFDLRAKIG